MSRIVLWLMISLLVMQSALAALIPCTGRVVNPATDICWDCLFPMTIGRNTVIAGSNPDTPNPASSICVCSGHPLPRVGTALGYWEPMALVDVTRSPFCLVNLGGIRLGNGGQDGAVAVNSASDNSSFFHVHWYNYPLMQLLGWFTPECRTGGGFTLNYLSELDPTWGDDVLALTLFPETSQLANLASQLACAADATAAASGLANDHLFWCAGAHGTLYPVMGQVGEHLGGVQSSVLLSERLMFKLHRSGLVKDSSASHVCGEKFQPIMPKSRYRYQMVNPTATTGKHGCQPFGRTTMVWGATLEPPTSRENYGYLIWKKRNCCI